MTQKAGPRSLSGQALSELLGPQQFGTLALRRDPRAAVHVPGGDVWSFAVAEGEAEVSEVTTTPGDATGRELLAMVPGAAKPQDEDAFLEQLVAERRVVIRLKVSRLYGTALDVNG